MLVASQDGVGAPRKQVTLERERLVLAEARRLSRDEKRGLRYEDAVRVLGEGVSRAQINYTLTRLASQAKLRRQDGYSWYPTIEAVR